MGLPGSRRIWEQRMVWEEICSRREYATWRGTEWQSHSKSHCPCHRCHQDPVAFTKSHSSCGQSENARNEQVKKARLSVRTSLQLLAKRPDDWLCNWVRDDFSTGWTSSDRVPLEHPNPQPKANTLATAFTHPPCPPAQTGGPRRLPAMPGFTRRLSCWVRKTMQH